MVWGGVAVALRDPAHLVHEQARGLLDRRVMVGQAHHSIDVFEEGRRPGVGCVPECHRFAVLAEVLGPPAR